MPHMAYTETINAGQIAVSILDIGAQLAKEMSFDLQNLEKENEILRLQYQTDFVLRNASDAIGYGSLAACLERVDACAYAFGASLKKRAPAGRRSRKAC